MLGNRGRLAVWARLVALVLMVGMVSWWRPLAASATGLAGTFVSLSPARVLDTRIDNGAMGPVAANSTIHVQIAGRGGVPSTGVSAVVLNVTETEAQGAGYITIFPDGTARPTASNLNFPKADTRANQVTVKLGSNGKIALASSTKYSLQLIADVSGYFLAGTPSAAGAFVPLNPARVLDTRVANGATGPVAANSTIHVQVAGRGGVPSTGVSAVVLNVTETHALLGGYVTVYPDGTTRPAASNLNYPGGDTRANLVTVKLGGNGAVAFASTTNSTLDLIADVAGYYVAGTPTAAGTFMALDPVRVLDTRVGTGATGPLAANSTIHPQVTGRGGVPATGASAVVLNVTETEARASGYLTVYPDGTSRPTASTLNFPAGDTRANLATVRLGGTGRIAIASTDSSTVQVVADVAGYYLTGIGPITCSDPMTLVFDTTVDTSRPNQVAFTLQGGGPVTVRWGGAGAASPAPTGAGSVQTYAASPGTVGYTYASAGTYTVTVCGTVTHFSSPYQTTLIAVRSFGDLGTTDYTNAFLGAAHLTAVPPTLPGVATNLSRMFREATAFNQDISGWDTSRVTDMSGMFDTAYMFNAPIGTWDTGSVTDMNAMFRFDYAFNEPIGGWHTGNVTDMSGMFDHAQRFNQPIGGWDTSRVTDMSGMFENANDFDQPLGGWDTSHVANMSAMFDQSASFDQPIGGWDTSQVTDMSEMFALGRFNQPIGAWDTSNVTDMRAVFASNLDFNQPIGAWNTGRVTTMSGMFYQAIAFNQPIGGWDTARVTTMRGMFEMASAYNQPVDTWDTGNATDMSRMFANARAFNQPVDSWNTSKVVDMNAMFSGASMFDQPVDNWSTAMVTDMGGLFESTRFDQNIGGWNIGAVTQMTGILAYVPLSTAHYDALLTGWASQAVHRGIFLDVGSSTYSSAAAGARATLVDTDGWTVFDGGPA